MLDMKMIRENSENIRKMLKDRNVEFDLGSLLDLDKKRRELIISTDGVRKTSVLKKPFKSPPKIKTPPAMTMPTIDNVNATGPVTELRKFVSQPS